LNNLVEGVSLYGIAAANSAIVYAENNFYLNTDWPMYADRTVADFKAVYGNNSDNTYTSKTGNYPAIGLKAVGNAYDDSGLPVITAQINPAMLNPGGRSIKFDELNPSAVFTPSTYYNYTPMAASDVRVIIPLFAGADKATFTPDCSGPLPLTLLSFDAKLSQGVREEVIATWSTANEMNSKGFEVERSLDANDFNTVGYVAAQNTAGNHSYSFVDTDPSKGISYYRLKQIDLYGKFTYSKIVAINNKSNISLSVYPNPVSDNITVTHPKASNGAILKIMTINGQTVSSINTSLGAVISFANIKSLTKGNYLLIFENGTERSAIKFIKQ
jgi:hypothetical protein